MRSSADFCDPLLFMVPRRNSRAGLSWMRRCARCGSLRSRWRTSSRWAAEAMSCIGVQCSRHDSGRGRTRDRACEPRRCPVTGLPHYPKCFRRSDGPETEASTAVSTKRWRCGMSCSPNWPASTASPDASRWTPPSACCGAWWLSPRQFQPESGPAPVQILGVFESSGLRFDRPVDYGNARQCVAAGARARPLLAVSSAAPFQPASLLTGTGNWSSLRCSPRGFWRALPPSS